MEKFTEKAIELAVSVGSKLLLALAVYIIGRAVIKYLMKLIGRAKAFDKMDATARAFMNNFIKTVLTIVLIISIVGILGVPMASIVALIASCGVAVGMAMQGSLANIAGGIMLLIFRPFNVGDYIAADGEEGVVKSIGIMYTLLNTVDNKTVSIPNGSLMNANISNFTAEDKRRVDLTFNISGEHDIEEVRATIMKAITQSDKVLADPAPQIEPFAGIPGGLEYAVRPWCKTDDYWDTYFELMRDIPTALGKAGIGGPQTPVKVNK